MGGDEHTLPASALSVLPTRYLGVFLGGTLTVQRHWEQHIAPRVTSKIQQLLHAGLPKTCYGRTLAIKTHAFASVIFHITNQAPFDLDPILGNWTRQFWDLYWATDAWQKNPAGGHPPSLVRHTTEVQDHSDGGTRALHPTEFAASLHATWIRRLINPSPQPWKNILWSMINHTYGHLRLGQRLLVSTTPFSLLPGTSGCPPLFCRALKAWGSLPTPARVEGPYTYMEAATDPLVLNPSGWSDTARPRRLEHVPRYRHADATVQARREQYAARMTQAGLSQSQHLLPYLDFARGHDGTWRAAADAHALQNAFGRPIRMMAEDIVSSWAPDKIRALAEGPQTLSEGEWIAWRDHAGSHRLGRITRCRRRSLAVHLHQPDSANTLTPAGEATYNPATATQPAYRLLVWLESPPTEAERRRHDGMPAHLIVQHMTPRRPPRPPQLKLAGPLSDGLLDPTRWSQSGLPTLSSPTTATLARIQNHETLWRSACPSSCLYQKEAPPLRLSDMATMWGHGTALLAKMTASRKTCVTPSLMPSPSTPNAHDATTSPNTCRRTPNSRPPRPRGALPCLPSEWPPRP